MIDLARALELAAGALPAPRAEEVALAEAAGRVLAEEVRIPFPLPRFDGSAMDGYGVRSADLEGASPERPVRLRVAGVSAAGSPAGVAVTPGACVQVMTGAPIPEGADAVVIVERTSGFAEPGAEVAFFHAPRPGENVRRAGEELEEGAPLVGPGAVIGPGELGVVASAGRARVRVFARPRVAILSTGDELREPGEPLGPGEIYNSNLHVMADIARRAGAEVTLARVVRDEPGALGAAVREAAAASDLLLTTGGVSMGRFDHVPAALEAAGLARVFHKVAQKPGKPLLLAAGGGKVAFGLPGNPVSTFICMVVHVWPALRAMQGARAAGPVTARLAAPFPRDRRRHRFLPGRLWQGPGGELLAAPSARRGSHMLTSAVGAGAILDAAPGEGPLPEGAPISVRPLPWAALGAAGEEG